MRTFAEGREIFGACANSVYQALFPMHSLGSGLLVPYQKEPPYTYAIKMHYPAL